MCGIMGYAGLRPAAPILLEGLSSLEYRGYDSAGIAVMGPSGDPAIRKSAGKLSALVATTEGRDTRGHKRHCPQHVGPTHGRGPDGFNAHPHSDCHNSIVVVHNGIVENFVELRKELEDRGHSFSSETDSECIPPPDRGVPPAGVYA